jgi:FAD/FMN-containing dehydrogenase
MNKKRRILGISLSGLGLALLLKGFYDLGSFSGGGVCTEQRYWSRGDGAPASLMQVNFESKNLVFSQMGGYANDASCLNKTAVAGIVDVRTEEDLLNAMAFAKEHDLKISIAGQQHSMGGQTMVRGGLLLDMKHFNKVLQLEEDFVRVQSGILWSDLQKVLDEKGRAVKAMQSINIFTVGGTVSVNAHGIALNPGPIASTIRSLTLLTPKGEILRLSPSENENLFRQVIGGYGLFGVILEVELDTVPNRVLAKKVTTFSTEDFETWFLENVNGKPEIPLFYARLSIVPGAGFLREVSAHVFTEKDEALVPKLNENFNNSQAFLKRFIINFSKTGRFGKWLRWTLEKRYSSSECLTQNEAMSQPDEVCDVTRNTAMYDSMEYLKSDLKDTDILQEYFVPFDQFDAFVEQLRTATEEEGVNLLNVTIRVVHKDEVSALPYATEDMFGFVLYFNHRLSVAEQEKLTAVTQRLIHASQDLGGTFYLPYQLVYSPEDLQKSYPGIGAFMQAKREQDPEELFSNKWYEKYREL